MVEKLEVVEEIKEEKKDNLEIYNFVRRVPDEAKKPIKGGRLRGMTDINPMYRIKTLTATFGPVGIGWYYDITKKELVPGVGDEIVGFVDINLYVKVDGQWSKPIQGTGGSSYISKEKSGLYTSDEVFKMALTDAISVACKALGIGADVYWDKDTTKYSQADIEPQEEPKLDQNMLNTITTVLDGSGYDKELVLKHLLKEMQVKTLQDLNVNTFKKAMEWLQVYIDNLNKVVKGINYYADKYGQGDDARAMMMKATCTKFKVTQLEELTFDGVLRAYEFIKGKVKSREEK